MNWNKNINNFVYHYLTELQKINEKQANIKMTIGTEMEEQQSTENQKRKEQGISGNKNEEKNK